MRCYSEGSMLQVQYLLGQAWDALMSVDQSGGNMDWLTYAGQMSVIGNALLDVYRILFI